LTSGHQTGEILRNYPAGTLGISNGMSRKHGPARILLRIEAAHFYLEERATSAGQVCSSIIVRRRDGNAMASAISDTVLGVLLLLINSCRGQEARCFLAVLTLQCTCVTSSCTTISPRCALLFAPSFYIMLHHSIYECLRFCTWLLLAWLLVSMGPT
jgi:hypothetical protein